MIGTYKFNSVVGVFGFSLALFLVLVTASPILAAPQGMTVVHGSASASQNGSQLTITASQNAFLNWQSFNIAPGETTTFHQPSPHSVVWNQIADQNPSQIWGTLNANGYVVLMNQNGFYFGPNCSINVGGFVAASAAVMPAPSAGGGLWSYQGPPPNARIINYGEIKVHSGGSLFLIAEGIENHGLLSAPDGKLGLYAGKEVLISERPDGRGLSATVRLPSGSIDNSGKLVADAGTIALHARVVNQDGVVQANSVRHHHGVIELVAADAVNLGPNSLLQADGDATTTSQGGQISVKAEHSFADAAGSRIELRGGGQGGDGGSIEISAPAMASIESRIDGTATKGSLGGRLLLDPQDIIIGNSGNGSAGSGTVDAGASPGSTLRLNIGSAFLGLSQIDLQATRNIKLDTNTRWDLDQSTGNSSPGCQLTLEAGNNIQFGDGSRIIAGSGWSVTLDAGVDFTSPTHIVRPGIGGIYLNGGPGLSYNGSIDSFGGNITLNAGLEVILKGGYIHADNGGNISITTGTGDVNAGTKALNPYSPYSFDADGYSIDALNTGGIGTLGGGDVTINSGRDILSTSANIGAWGADKGNVRLTAKRDIKGYFTVRNGTGVLDAGEDVGDMGTPASFGLISGGWSISAARDIYLNEIFNPNGALNYNTATYGARLTHQFDYAPDSFVNLIAGNSVQLLGSKTLPAGDNSVLPIFYPPILDITAGAGGVVLGNTEGVSRGNSLVLYPSILGSLNIHTTDGGSLKMARGQYGQIVLSDSGSADYTTFKDGHAHTPVHSTGDGAGVHLDIDGNIENLFLTSPEAADIHAGGDAINFALSAQNLFAGDVTQVHIDGNYSSRSDWTSVTLDGNPNLDVLTDPLLSVNPMLGNRLRYDPATKKLSIQNTVQPTDLDFLLHPMAYVLDPVTHQQELDAQGNPRIAPATFTTDTAALNRLFTDSQDIPTAANAGLRFNGLQLGGPGRFDISAHNMDLGISRGIRSVGPLNNPALGPRSLPGASITVTLAGDLDITSSQIASFNGGSITINSLGRVDVGSADSFISDDTPKGIYTGHGGAVTVHAVGDINVQGSRIASYDGGDLTVISDTGSVDAGSGARGLFRLTSSAYDPVSQQVITRNDKFFGSGIMATTRTDSDARMGDITVLAPKGDVLANSGGILQLAFNHHNQAGAQVTLEAGRDIIASHSGVLGANVSLNAGRNIVGLIVASENVTVAAQQNASVTVLAGGTAAVSAGQNISGSIVGGGNVSVSGSEITASVISTGGSASTSGNASAASVGAFAGVTAPTAQKTVESADKTVASQSLAQAGQEDDQKKRIAGKNPTLMRRVGRVTVVLPPKS